MSQGLKNGGWIFAEVRKFIDNRGNVSLLRVREVQGRRSVLFRCVDRSGGFNHIEYLLESRPGNRIVAVDSSSLPIGELLSLHQRRQFVELARHSASNLVDGFTDTGSLFFKNFLTSVRMIGLALAGNCNDALKIYRDFSPEIQRMKSIQIVRIQACQSSDHEQECLAAVLDLQKSHPDAVCTHFFSYGYFLRKREFANALKSIDKVEQFVGGDSFLDTVRSEVHLASGNLDDAETLANRAKKSVPDVFAVHWQCLKVAIRKKDYNAAILTMKQLDKRFRCKWDDLKDIPEFTEFTRSSKYKEWQEYLRKRMK